MASPQLENGYTRIANELIEAIVKMWWSNYETRIFWVIVRKTYGFKKKKDWISLSQISELTGILKPHVSLTLKKLISKNIIYKEGRKICIQKDYDNWVYPDKQPKKTENKKLPKSVTNKKLPNMVTEVTEIGNKKLPNMVTTKEITKDNIQKKDTYSRASEKTPPIPYQEIIEYLNLKAEKNYRPNITKTHDLIKARFNAGFNLDHFKKVIDIKTSQWKGDPEMDRFLRPETLFGNKFEGYLNEKIMTEMRKNGQSIKHFENERTYTDEEQRTIDEKFYRTKT